MDYLGIDYGSKFIGLAWSSDALKVVVPLQALRVHSTEQVLKDLPHLPGWNRFPRLP